MSENDVFAQVGAETQRLLRVAAMIGRYLAEVQRRRLAEAEGRSQQEAHSIQQAIEKQRRLAAPIYERATNKRFWSRATAQEAAYVYGVACRFADVDTKAATAVRLCEDEARNRRWEISIPHRQEEENVVVPAVPGEENVDWNKVVNEAMSAVNDQQVTSVNDQPGPANSVTKANEEAKALEWFQRHYPDQITDVNNPLARRTALLTYSSMAAEGLNLDAPPAIKAIDDHAAGRVEGDTVAGVRQAARQWMGGGPDDNVLTRVDQRAIAPFHASWAAEQAGDYPNLDQWGFHCYAKGGESYEVQSVTLMGVEPAPGEYTDFALSAAAGEAHQVGMSAEVYLDHLTPTQRRGLLYAAAYPGMLEGRYAKGAKRLAEYRMAYAKESRATRPHWSKREPKATGQSRKGTAMTSVEYSSNFFHQFGLGDNVDALLRNAAGEHGADFSTTTFRTAYLEAVNQAVKPFGLTVTASGVAYRDTGSELPDPATIKDALTEALSDDWMTDALEAADNASVAWDSPQAREAWAEKMLASGIDSDAVRAAKTGDMAMHEPAHKATAPPSSKQTTKSDRKPPSTTHRHRLAR